MKIKNVLLWVLTAIFLVLAIAFITGATGVLFLLAAVMVAPIPRLRYLVDELISRYAKPAFVVILLAAAVLVIPKETSDGTGATVNTDKGTAQISTSDRSDETEASQTVTEATEDQTNPPSTQFTEETQPTQTPTETTQPTQGLTQAPTEPPTEHPTEAPTQPPTVPQKSAITFISWPKTIARGTEGSVTIQGEPNTKYSIKVFYKSGPSSAAGLDDKVSDENGYVTWTWKVSSRTGTGTFKIVVSGGGDSAQVEYAVVDE